MKKNTINTAHADPAVREQFIEAMSAVSHSVSVVTTSGPAGKLGVTVSAFASLSANPPLLLCCINQISPTAEAIRHNGVFALNVLSSEQRHVSETFAGMGEDGQAKAFDFSCAQWSEIATGSPILRQGVSSFDCRVKEISVHGTHLLIIGAVTAAILNEGEPLLYWSRQYSGLQPTQTSSTERN